MRFVPRLPTLTFSLLLLASVPVSVQGQWLAKSRFLAPEPPPKALSLGDWRALKTDESHWLTGGIVGTAIGTLAFLFGSGKQGSSGTAKFVVISVGAGALIGGIPGALIGSAFKKHDDGIASSGTPPL